jgi:hypothetical protein
MSDTLITIIAIFLAAVLMFIFPLISVSDRNDDISQTAIQTSTVQYVDKIRNTGKISYSDYSKFEQTLNATGNKYEIEMELKSLDENLAKKTSNTSYTKIGENVYYTIYTSQIMDQLTANSNKTLALKEGDIISVSVKNTNTTISQSLKNFFYRVSGNNNYQVSAQHGGLVTVNGTN